MNLYLEGYADAISGYGYDMNHATSREYNRGWDDAVRAAT
jgi:hypothetical protein